MSHKLEEYLKKERDNLDVELPDDNAIWDRIGSRLSQKEEKSPVNAGKIRWIRIRNIAAAAVVVFCLGYLVKDIIDTIASGRTVTLSSIDSSLGQREEQYKEMVSFRITEVSGLQGTGDAIVKELFSEMARVDTIYRQSMADLRELGPDEKIINMIFDTYEQKIRLLELIILETNNKKIHENDEKINL